MTAKATTRQRRLIPHSDKGITTCPPDYPKTSLESSADTINHYCKLGCASSMCNTINTLQNSDASEEVANEALELCNNACSDFCTKGSNIALVTAA
ncbi:Thionin-2.2 [Thalictrum thalictroides]|uniref:Thionin-2.2 n=1 Tax=Thalictrum thalictroides TaxID=46969 RepID=A0A7J6VRQ6_THATH|nr:Thionin-2.2 [Thalictrum thalictroides]